MEMQLNGEITHGEQATPECGLWGAQEERMVDTPTPPPNILSLSHLGLALGR